MIPRHHHHHNHHVHHHAHALEALAQRLGNPPWFWPLVMLVLFGLLVLGSQEGAP